ncbi:MAG: outer membrane beta-barrel domain-containing protein [Oligoflexia bacterium]|nr:outer membrane beta-barrel domain-containing protein [Oligoflexia bacterium]
MKYKTILLLLILALLPAPQAAAKNPAAPKAPAASPSPSSSATAAAEAAERVNVENIKEKYWARGDESEIGVVQNRLYSKANKIEIGMFGGSLTTDPFLTVKSVGGSFGFHFSEYLAAHFLAWKTYVGHSGAYTGFQEAIQEQEGIPAIPSTNDPKSYFGAEGAASILYGKLSLIGKAIIYYDMHLNGGLGVTSTYTGNYFTPSIGIGQQVYLNKQISFRLDYRAMFYRERIVTRQTAADQGAINEVSKGTRTNWTHAITLGVNFFFGFQSAPSEGAAQ